MRRLVTFPCMGETLAGVAKPLGLLALSARLELAGLAAGGPKRAARLLWFGLAGR